jgi:hypothetical protein
MNRTVHVHRKGKFLAVEIHDAPAKRFLPVKIAAAKLLPFEPFPKQHFGQRHLLAKPVGALLQISAVWNDLMSHDQIQR